MFTEITSYDFLPEIPPFRDCNYIAKDSSGRVFAYEHCPIYYSKKDNYDERWGVGTGKILSLGVYSPEETCKDLRFKWNFVKQLWESYPEQLWESYPDTTSEIEESIIIVPEKHSGLFVIELETDDSTTRQYFTGFDVLGNPEFDSDTQPFLRPVIFFQEVVAKKIASKVYSEVYTNYGVKVIRIEEMINVN